MRSGTGSLIEGSSSAPSQWPVDTLLVGDTLGTKEGPSLTEFVFQGGCPRTTLLTQTKDLPDLH